MAAAEQFCVGFARLDFWWEEASHRSDFFCEKLLEAFSMSGKANPWLALRTDMLLSQLEKLVTPL